MTRIAIGGLVMWRRRLANQRRRNPSRVEAAIKDGTSIRRILGRPQFPTRAPRGGGRENMAKRQIIRAVRPSRTRHGRDRHGVWRDNSDDSGRHYLPLELKSPPDSPGEPSILVLTRRALDRVTNLNCRQPEIYTQQEKRALDAFLE